MNMDMAMSTDKGNASTYNNLNEDLRSGTSRSVVSKRALWQRPNIRSRLTHTERERARLVE